MVDAQQPPATPRALDDTEDLHRRILPEWVVKDDAGRRRVSAAAYKARSGEHCSVYVASECETAVVLTPYTVEGASIGAIGVDACRSRGYVVQRDVLANEHLSHVHLIQPTGLSKGARHAICRELALRTRWVVGVLTWDVVDPEPEPNPPGPE